MSNILLIGLISILSGFLYRCGGTEKRGKWYDFLFNTKSRDIGCSALTTLAFHIIHPHIPWWSLLLHFGLLWGALTTYWDFLNKDREVWWTWIITGIFYGLSALPLLSVCWSGVLLRSLLLGITTMAWRMMIRPGFLNDAVWDEAGVGFLLVISVLIC